jgi:hypothetical protein
LYWISFIITIISFQRTVPLSDAAPVLRLLLLLLRRPNLIGASTAMDGRAAETYATASEFYFETFEPTDYQRRLSLRLMPTCFKEQWSFDLLG